MLKVAQIHVTAVRSAITLVQSTQIMNKTVDLLYL